MQVVIGPSLPGERVALSTGGSSSAKVLLVAGSALLALVGFAGEIRPVPLFLAGLLLLQAWSVVPLSEVETDGLFLYVSQLFKSARVPLTDVSAVRVGWRPRSFRVIVDLRTETTVGRRIVYRPPVDWMATAYDHRAVRELRALIAQARAAEARGGAGGPT